MVNEKGKRRKSKGNSELFHSLESLPIAKRRGLGVGSSKRISVQQSFKNLHRDPQRRHRDPQRQKE
jgi:hypothetical protein